MHERTFEPTPSSVHAARAFVGDRLTGLPPHVRDATVLLVSELVMNAVQHTEAAYTVWINIQAGVIRAGVDDLSRSLPTVRPLHPDTTHGRGLAMVDALAERWGTDATPSGKSTWFEIRS